ncbi:MAG: YitT family protein [Bacteroidales bacterium]
MKDRIFQFWYPLKDYTFIFIGLMLYAVGFTGFLVPHQVVTGGMGGISALIYYATGLPINISFGTINGILLLFAIKLVGFKFSIRTIYGVVILTFLFKFMGDWITEPLVKGDTFMSIAIGAMLCGAGVGLVFTSNGSTGGTDIIAAIVNKYRNITFGRMILYCDILIISSSYILFRDIEKVMYGYVTMAIMTYTVDMLINGIRQSVQFMIFSKQYEEIAEAINKEVNRGVTILDGTGWYSKEPVKVVVVMARRSEAVSIMRLCKSIDHNAFISQSNVIGVYGQGFDQIKG